MFRAPARSQFPRLAISASRSKKRPLTPNVHRLLFGTVSHGTDWQGLSPLSWLSYSPPSVWLGRRHPQSVGSERRRSEAPHASQVERALTGLSPECAVARTPWTGFSPAWIPTAPRRPRCARGGEGYFSVAPPPPPSDRTRRFADALSRADWFREPPSSTDKHLSMHPALRADRVAGG